MPEENLRGMDKTKQQSGAGTAISSNTGPSFQIGGLFSNNLPSPGPKHEPKSPSKTLSNTVRPAKHCDSCGLDQYYVSMITEEDTEINTFSQPAPEMLHDNLPSPHFTSFSGVTLDQAQRGQLSEFHVLENDGDTEILSREWEAIATEVGGPEKLSSLVKIGLAAVRVRVGNTHLRGPDTGTAELSGFRLSQDMVITCAHFTDWDFAGNNVQSFLNGQNGICEAIQARGSKEANRFTLRLWAIHKAWDIAVFRITDWPKDDSKNCVVKKEDIYLATPEERRNLENAPRARFWSVGYNLAVKLNELRGRFEDFYSRRHDDEKIEIIHRYNFNGANPPGPEFLQANMRTVSFGTKIGHPHNAKDHQECVELSAWYGRSGSMVCAEKSGSPAVIGIVQGGNKDSDCNLILLFNTEMREWLHAATELRESSDLQEISRRVVMA